MTRTRGKRRRTQSDFGRRLLEKQKVRYTYGLGERQLRRYVEEAKRSGAGDPANRLYQLLETRLDNVIYRMGLAKTRRMARQLVSHGHVCVNGKRVTIPSFHVTEKDTVTVREGSREKAPFRTEEKEDVNVSSPSWVIFDPKKMEGKLKGEPLYVPGESTLDFPQVLEFYSR